MDTLNVRDVVQFMGDPAATLWVVSLNALNVVTGFNDFSLVAWGTGEVRNFSNTADFSAAYPVYLYGLLTAGGIDVL